MFWTGGSKNNLQRKNKNLMISRPQFYPLRKALLKEKPPQSLFLKHGHALQLWSTRFSLFLLMTPPFHSWWLCSVPASVPTPRDETSPSFFLLSSYSTFLMNLPQLGVLAPRACHAIYCWTLWFYLYFVSVYIHWFCFRYRKKLFSQESKYVSLLH